MEHNSKSQSLRSGSSAVWRSCSDLHSSTWALNVLLERGLMQAYLELGAGSSIPSLLRLCLLPMGCPWVVGCCSMGKAW